MRRRRARWAPLAAGGIVVAAGFGIALVEAYHFPKGSIWVVVGAAALLVILLRALTARKR